MAYKLQTPVTLSLSKGRVSLACPELAEGKGELTSPPITYQYNSSFKRTASWHFKGA